MLGNIFPYIEMSLNMPRNTLNYMCDLDPFSKIRSQIMHNIPIHILITIIPLGLLCSSSWRDTNSSDCTEGEV